MTAASRQVLLDCNGALEDLRAGPTGLQWRTRWAAAVALLRAVGHVLQIVDAKSSPAMKKAVGEAYSSLQDTKPEPRIYWSFIREERNNILKEYRFTARQNVTVRPGTTGINLNTGEEWEVAPALPTLYDHVMGAGPFAGRDPRDLVAEAIEWWGEYLDRIDHRASTLGAA
jgi:hypothetical protein